jgi:hypothetical protein
VRVREELTAAGIPTWMDVSAGNPFPLCLSVCLAMPVGLGHPPCSPK